MQNSGIFEIIDVISRGVFMKSRKNTKNCQLFLKTEIFAKNDIRQNFDNYILQANLPY